MRKVKLRNVAFNVDDSNHKAFWLYYEQGLWESYLFDYIDYYVDSSSHFMDIGSSFGPIALYVASLEANVYALDPDPIMQEYLKKNLAQNPKLIEKIHNYNLAITPQNKSYRLRARKEYGQSSSSLLDRTLDQRSTIDVSGVSLIEFVTTENIKSLDFIKIDIEGGEFMILPEIGKTLQHLGYPTTCIAFHTQYLAEKMIQGTIKTKWLSSLAYKICYKLNINIYNRQIKKTIQQCLDELKGYKYCYHKSKLVNHEEIIRLVENQELDSLLFTNTTYGLP